MSNVLPNKDYVRFLADGRFMIQRSPSGAHVFYPRVAEPGTGEELEWVEASGRGVVYATTVIYPNPPLEKYNVSLIDLDEGPRMMSRVEDVPPNDVKIGMKVKARIIDEKGFPLVIFSPA